MGKPKIHCANCQKKCSGEVLRVTDKYFHKSCFQCIKCKKSLAVGGFFSKDSNYYCVGCYQKTFGTKCAVCQQYVEGEVVSTMGNTYHQKCFTCTRCNQPFESGSKVTNTGKEILCEKCVVGGTIKQKTITQQHASPTKATAQQQHNEILQKPTSPKDIDPNNCAGCGAELKEGQALIALERQWHIWCFRCVCCGTVLSGEYMGKDGQPYCEKDYQKSFGVKCAYCERYISGKVLQAGDNHHFHPTCARCSKCGDPFGDGEEMYLQGTAIWHPRCGPGPSENGILLNGNGAAEIDHISNSAMSEIQYHRTISPGLVLREYNQNYGEDISRIYTYSYLAEDISGLRKPIDPYDKKPVSPHFHRPNFINAGRPPSRPQSRSRSAMKVLVDSIRTETPRPKSPGMNNEEPIEMSHYPGGKKPKPGEKSKIERDDFPAPPHPCTDPERRRRYSDSYKGVQTSDDEDQVDKAVEENIEPVLKKGEEELKKINSGMSKVILKDIKERQKYKIWKQNNLDPRNASRTPSANKEPVYKLRYESPLGASPSRNLDHSRPFEDELFDRSMSYRGSVGRVTGVGNSYNAINSYRSPKPGSGYKHSTLPSSIRNGYSSDFSYGGLGDKTHSTEFSCGKSDISVDSITEGDRRALGAEIPASSTYSGAIYNQYPQSGLVRRSLPNMAHSMLVHEPAKIYPYHLLLITNYRLPADVDRCNLERHLSDAEFEAVCGCARAEFYRLPQWRRNELKRRARLF
ncbi:CLUMA_CG019116, isoform B [Clunio marinus]|uniref:CLUMA_CG019116, isoform B n=1 Tax=Clunio marinus TaxID=568069 RepID=A0A1J1J0A3_9DIPT|nr:CLUMA_CG019116, isoform B [Clunio marinus]